MPLFDNIVDAQNVGRSKAYRSIEKQAGRDRNDAYPAPAQANLFARFFDAAPVEAMWNGVHRQALYDAREGVGMTTRSGYELKR